MLKDIPNEEKPRERLMKYGVQNISNEDIISIILKTGTKNCSVKQLSILLLSKVKNIEQLKDYNVSSLIKIKGIGEVKALELLAALELGRRVYYEKKIDTKLKLNNPTIIYEYFKYKINDLKQECFYCIYLDNQKNMIDYRLLFIGTINMSLVHPREVFKEAYLLSASCIICLHNHPSGSCNPSEEDKKLTKNLIYIGRILGIEVVDHIIIGKTEFYSFFQNNNEYFN